MASSKQKFKNMYACICLTVFLLSVTASLSMEWGMLPHIEAIKPTHVYLAGIALDYCVCATAFDIKTKTECEVIVVADACPIICPAVKATKTVKLEKAGVKFISSEKVLERLKNK
eukprot:Platyproteum_vivax@DN3669_c0_g1_i1.p1